MWMKPRKIAILAAICSLAPIPVNAMVLESPTFRPNATLPVSTIYDRSGCHGGNRAPALRWREVPPATRSFALIVRDPDAPAPGGWWHWARYDIPSNLRALPYGVSNGRFGRDARTSWNDNAYNGPCPPPGLAHHYVFTLYALDVAHLRGASPVTTAPALAGALRGHVLASATLVGRYGER